MDPIGMRNYTLVFFLYKFFLAPFSQILAIERKSSVTPVAKTNVVEM